MRPLRSGERDRWPDLTAAEYSLISTACGFLYHRSDVGSHMVTCYSSASELEYAASVDDGVVCSRTLIFRVSGNVAWRRFVRSQPVIYIPEEKEKGTKRKGNKRHPGTTIRLSLLVTRWPVCRSAAFLLHTLHVRLAFPVAARASARSLLGWETPPRFTSPSMVCLGSATQLAGSRGDGAAWRLTRTCWAGRWLSARAGAGREGGEGGEVVWCERVVDVGWSPLVVARV